ncbi:MAG: TM2 domain-containing protein [Methylobacter sp.]|uniref:TM2 domain-containing protein n=1 Tax=Candidatus Methylobacter titanis TaxID=3053457 RepID=A0AA43Q7U9_9GAMM|nr:TM2 domain-containing protein [Candidatus Methylobacter titanis]MDI1293928.1 TM2 domain-containing protein [Candidatus Methylobacter titanis]
MIGQIETYDPDRQSGVIKSEDTLYTFDLDAWVADVPPDEGDDVNFDAEGSIAGNIDLVGAYLEPPKAVKYKYLATALALFLGFAGAHRFYLGFYALAVFQLTLTVILYVTGLPGFAMLWPFVEFILLAGGHINKDAKGRPLK